MPTHFAGVDFTDFWCRGDYADSLSEAPPSPGTIAELEQELGYRLPAAYVELCRHQNGGLPRKCYHAVPHVTSYGAEDHIEIAELYAIGRTAAYSLGNPDSNTAFWVNDCESPPLGIYFANCPDHGHQMVALGANPELRDHSGRSAHDLIANYGDSARQSYRDFLSTRRSTAAK